MVLTPEFDFFSNGSNIEYGQKEKYPAGIKYLLKLQYVHLLLHYSEHGI